PVVRVAAGLFSGPTDAGQLHECLVRRGGICPDAICNLVPDTAGLALELNGHRIYLHFPCDRIRLRSRLRRLALPDPVGSPYVSASDAAHDPANRGRRAAVAILFGARPARHPDWADHGLSPDHAPLCRMDDQELHRRSTTRGGAGSGDTRCVTVAHRL